MAMAHDDWRLSGQDRYLKSAVLFWRQYEPAPGNDHDHCEFCGEKFMSGESKGVLAAGYSTEDRYRWVCRSCFNDFVDLFGWSVG